MSRVSRKDEEIVPLSCDVVKKYINKNPLKIKHDTSKSAYDTKTLYSNKLLSNNKGQRDKSRVKIGFCSL